MTRGRRAISLTGQLLIGKRLNQPREAFFLQRRASVTNILPEETDRKREEGGTDETWRRRGAEHSADREEKEEKGRGASHLPGHHDEEIHDVPDVAQIGAAVEDEAEGEDLEARFDAEDPEEVDFRGLELLREYSLVVLRQMLLEGEDHAIGDDGEQDGVLEGRPLDDEAGDPSYDVFL